MIYNLYEDNKDVESIVAHLDSKVIKLREKNLLKGVILNQIDNLYQTNIIDWLQENYQFDLNLSKKDEEDLINLVLDMSNLIDKILEKHS